VVWVEPVIDVAPEIAPTMEPWSCADEDASFKPFWTVVTRGSTGIRNNVIVSVGAIRFYADADADADPARASREPDCDEARKDDKLDCAHGSSPHRCLRATDVPVGNGRVSRAIAGSASVEDRDDEAQRLRRNECRGIASSTLTDVTMSIRAFTERKLHAASECRHSLARRAGRLANVHEPASFREPGDRQ
jgi:hypothetical protein